MQTKFIKAGIVTLLLVASVPLAGCNNYVKGRVSNGKSVVYSINDDDVTADDFNKLLLKSNDAVTVYGALIDRAIANKAVSTTADLKADTKQNVAKLIKTYSSTYQDAQTELDKQAVQAGYDDINDMVLTQLKMRQITADYAKDHFDDLGIRAIRYILIKTTDSEASDEQKSKMNQIDSEIASGKDFSDVASKYSEDTTTSINGGMLGVIDKNSGNALDSSFFDAAMALKEGGVSDWVYSSSFGYFKIYCEANSKDTIKNVKDLDDPYTNLVSMYDTSLSGEAMWDEAKKLNVDYHGNENIKAIYRSHCGVTEDN